ncbi:MAG: hypothetical protein K9H49_05885 [Bacteroidales bacterium]|nr:hypothetical protein [Bacteroidales bacterium]MCF8404360.1 hypothetical protein [Bacteroidales bacterium]
MKTLKSYLNEVSEKLKPLYMENDAMARETLGNDNESGGTASKPTEIPAKSKANTSSVLAAIFNGLGVGLLLGLLLGLAVSPVVSGIIGTLSSLLVILLGLNDKYMGIVKSVRIGSFGFFTVAGIILGMYIRTNNALSPTTTDLKEEYIKSGFEENEALYFTAQKTFDYVPVGWFGTTAADSVGNKNKNKETRSHLFSSKVDVSQCSILKSADREFPRSEIIYSYEAAGGLWKDLALTFGKELPDQVYVDALLAIRDGFCGLGKSGIIDIKSTYEIKQLNSANSLSDIKNTLIKAGGEWPVIFESIQDKIPEEYQKQTLLQLIKILTDEKAN